MHSYLQFSTSNCSDKGPFGKRLLIESANRCADVVFAIVGARVSAGLSDTFPTTASGVQTGAALLGGFLMLFGSRLGGGCTSGHGISGMPLLNTLSLVAVVSMFVSGIVTGLLLDGFDLLEIPPLRGRV